MYNIKIIYVPKYSYIIKFIKNEIPFLIHIFFAGLCQPQLLLFCATLTLFGLLCCQAQGQHIGSPTDNWK